MSFKTPPQPLFTRDRWGTFGLAYIWEYLHGTDPIAASSNPVKALRNGNRLAITFPRDIAANDLTVNVQAADSPAGPWGDIARSVNGAEFVSVAEGATAVETGTGSLRSVEVRDIHAISDPLHPRRFLRLVVRSNP